MSRLKYTHGLENIPGFPLMHAVGYISGLNGVLAAHMVAPALAGPR